MVGFYKGVLPLLLIVSTIVPVVPSAHALGTAPDLGAASTYAVFGKAGVTNDSAVGTTHIWGNVGADASVTDLTDATQVDGTINTPASGVEAAILSAYGELAAQGADAALNLAGTNTVAPGVYTVGATTLNGTLTLNGAGVYIFRSSSSIPVSAGAQVLLTNGATACNVFWQIPASMTIGAGAQMVGTIIANTELISFAAGATLQGRALSRIAQVTMDSNQITEPTCSTAATTSEGDGTLRRPVISVTKIPTPLALPGPGSVTYAYEVSNPGRYTMNNITLTDDKCSPVLFDSGDTNNDSLLQATEKWKYHCTAWLTQDTNNQAIATGHANGLPATDIAYATVNVGTLLPPPLIHVVKVPNLFTLPFRGGRVRYAYRITNPGVVALHYVQITDDKCGDITFISGDIDGDEMLDTNETWAYTCQSDLDLTTTNTVTVTGNANNETATDVAFATVVVAPRPAVIPPTVRLRSSAPPVAAPTPTPEVVPLLPNTGVGPHAASIPWMAIATGLLITAPFLFAAYQKNVSHSSRKN